jgi:predicted permease
LTSLLALFANNIFPILLTAACGYLAARYLKLTPRPISQIALYILLPALLYKLLTTNKLHGEDVLRTIAATITCIVVLGIIAWAVGRFIHLNRQLLAAMILVVIFGNMGNFGLALTSFAFGQLALAYASICFVTETILIYTVGIVIASMGKQNLGKAMLGLLKIPSIYALFVAILVNIFNWKIPLPLDRTISILSDAALPVMMVVLGIQLYQSNKSSHITALVLSNVLRLFGGAFIGVALGWLFSLKGAAYQASVIQSAMPAAVIITIIANEFDIYPSFVTNVVISSTLLSPFILTPLLYFLGA